MSRQNNRLLCADTELTVQGNHPFQLEGPHLIEAKVENGIQPEQLELLRKLEEQLERLKYLSSK
jgi:hypothetical protein